MKRLEELVENELVCLPLAGEPYQIVKVIRPLTCHRPKKSDVGKLKLSPFAAKIGDKYYSSKDKNKKFYELSELDNTPSKAHMKVIWVINRHSWDMTRRPVNYELTQLEECWCRAEDWTVHPKDFDDYSANNSKHYQELCILEDHLKEIHDFVNKVTWLYATGELKSLIYLSENLL